MGYFRHAFWENPSGRRYTYRKIVAYKIKTFLRRWGQRTDKHLGIIMLLMVAAYIAFKLY